MWFVAVRYTCVYLDTGVCLDIPHGICHLRDFRG